MQNNRHNWACAVTAGRGIRLFFKDKVTLKEAQEGWIPKKICPINKVTDDPSMLLEGHKKKGYHHVRKIHVNGNLDSFVTILNHINSYHKEITNGESLHNMNVIFDFVQKISLEANKTARLNADGNILISSTEPHEAGPATQLMRLSIELAHLVKSVRD